MRIAFLCSGLKPGEDGVGDYTRRLAGQFVRFGHPTVILALNDAQVSKAVVEDQEIDGVFVSALRLASTMTWTQRVVEARNWLNGFNPDWVSLQFVPFGFHRKGLCFGLGKWIEAMNRMAPWHLMFHELWLGLGASSSIKHRIWGGLQRVMILDLVRRLRPRIVHTQAEPHRIALSREQIKASILPLFSNIPQADDGDGWNGLLEPLITKAMGMHVDRSKLYLAGVFGGVHREWNAELTVNTLVPQVRRFLKRLVLVFCGKSNMGSEEFNKLKVGLSGRADLVAIGQRTEKDISRILQTLDLGLATTPRQIIQKSGSVAAMLEHGLPVLVTRNDWRLSKSDPPMQDGSCGLFSPKQFASLERLPTRTSWLREDRSVKRIADQVLLAMQFRSPANELSPQ